MHHCVPDCVASKRCIQADSGKPGSGERMQVIPAGMVDSGHVYLSPLRFEYGGAEITGSVTLGLAISRQPAAGHLHDAVLFGSDPEIPVPILLKGVNRGSAQSIGNGVVPEVPSPAGLELAQTAYCRNPQPLVGAFVDGPKVVGWQSVRRRVAARHDIPGSLRPRSQRAKPVGPRRSPEPALAIFRYRFKEVVRPARRVVAFPRSTLLATIDAALARNPERVSMV